MIHYGTVNKILDLVRRFDNSKINAKELTASMEQILLSDGWTVVKNCNIPHVIKSVCDDCTAYPFDERGKTPLCKTCKDNPKQTVL